MKEKIFILLDELVSMSDSTFTAESLDLELNELDRRIKRLNASIKRFESDKDDSKYFDISSQMIDRNIEVNLNKRIKQIENGLEEIELHLQESLSKENDNHKSIDKINSSISDCEKLIKILEQKTKNIKNDESKKVYDELIKSTQEKMHRLEDQNDQALLIKKEVEDELNILSQSKEDLSNRLEEEKSKLEDTQKSLSNEKNYYNYDAKKEDEEYLTNLHDELEKLEHEKLELLTDPANLANEAKKLVVENNMANAIAKIKELVSVIEEIPNIKETDIKKLKLTQEELKANIENKRNEIEENQYKTKENDVLESRVGYLNNLVEELTKRADSLKAIIDDIDNKSIIDLRMEISNAEESKAQLEESINELEKLNTENASMNIFASIIAYQKELDSINKTINKQTDDLEYLVNLSCTLENNVTNLEKKIAEKNTEIVAIEREISLKSKLIDEKSKLRDEEELSALEKELEYIDHRLKYKRTPQDIYNEIDCLLGSLDFDEPKKRTYTSRVERNKLKISEPVVEEMTPAPKKRLKILDVENPEEKKEINNQSNIEIIDTPIQEPKISIIEPDDEIGFNDIVKFIGDNK